MELRSKELLFGGDVIHTCVCVCACMCLHASVHAVQDQRQLFWTGTAQKQIQDIGKGGGVGRTPGSV